MLNSQAVIRTLHNQLRSNQAAPCCCCCSPAAAATSGACRCTNELTAAEDMVSHTDTVPLAPPAARISGASLQWVGCSKGQCGGGRGGRLGSHRRAGSSSNAPQQLLLRKRCYWLMAALLLGHHGLATTGTGTTSGGLPAEGHAKHGADVQVLGGQQRGLVLQHTPHLDLWVNTWRAWGGCVSGRCSTTA